MRNLAAASIIAFASLVASAHMAAYAVNDRAARAHEGWGGLTEMAQAPAAEIWYISGVVTLDGKTIHTQFIVPNEEGKPALLTFDSKDKCEAARAGDPEIVGTLTKFQEQVSEAGGTIVVSCEKFVRPTGDPT